MKRDDPLSPLRSTRPVDPDFADRLESSLRVQHAAGRSAPARPSPWRRVVLVAPVLLLVAVASAVLVLRDDTPSAALELHEAHNVVVTLPDGSMLVDPTGLELVDGTVVSVGDGGRAVIDDVELGAGSVVTIRGGELITADPATTTSTAAAGRDDRGPTPDPAPTTTLATSDTTRPRRDSVDADPRDEPPVADQPPDSTTTVPDTRPVDDSAPPETTAPPDDGAGQDREGGSDDVDPVDRVVDLALEVRRVEGQVAVRWRATGTGTSDLRVLLLRSEGLDAPDPDWPVGPGVTIAAETLGSDPGRFLDEIPGEDVKRRYRAVALLADEVVARSAVQTLAPDR